MTRGADTRDQILEEALRSASELGLEGLSIGSLARELGMSKSGLFAHFGSKESLQQQVLDRASELFTDRVVRPAIRLPRGEPRVQALFENYLKWSNSAPVPGGCLFVSASFEFDDRPGPVRDVLLTHVRNLRQTFVKAADIAVACGDFRHDLDTEQLAFEIHAVLLVYHVEARLFREEDSRERVRRAFDKIIAHARARTG